MKIVQVNTAEDAEIVKNEAAGIGLESEPGRQVISEDKPESCRPNRPIAARAIAGCLCRPDESNSNSFSIGKCCNRYLRPKSRLGRYG
jgi:hypothetical protein